MESVSCNLCGRNDAKPIYVLPDFLLERWEVQATLVKCQTCGLIYQNPRYTLQELLTFYPPEYEPYENKPGKTSTSRLLNAAIQYGMYKRRRFVTRYKRGGRWLDIGCASGAFLHSLSKFPNWELYGVEINPHAVQIARASGLNIFMGTLEEADYPQEFFDAITLWDVLEHLPDPKASLLEIHRILKPDGVLVLLVPNADSWDAKLFGRYWAGFDPPRHLYLFNRTTLRKLLEQAGFAINSMSCNIGSYPTFVLSVRFWLVGKGTKKKAREAIIKILCHPIVRIATSPFFYLWGLGIRGPQMVITATKSGAEHVGN